MSSGWLKVGFYPSLRTSSSMSLIFCITVAISSPTEIQQQEKSPYPPSQRGLLFPFAPYFPCGSGIVNAQGFRKKDQGLRVGREYIRGFSAGPLG